MHAIGERDRKWVTWDEFECIRLSEGVRQILHFGQLKTSELPNPNPVISSSRRRLRPRIVRLIKGGNVMAASPKFAPPLEPILEEKISIPYEPKPVVEPPHVRSLLAKMFEGHEEFLGWTQD
jgi:hypothetical protein